MRRIPLGLAFFLLVAALAAGPVPAAAQPAEVTGPGGQMVLGEADAPVTIIEYSSLTCPHCASFHNDTLPALKTRYIDTGKARLVYRDFPLDRLALMAAKLAHCAGPERYFSFLEILFRSQERWARAPDPRQALGRVARLGGIGTGAFDACMADDALETGILRERLRGQRTFEINSTPTFIINGRKYAGAIPVDEFDRILRRLLPDS